MSLLGCRSCSPVDEVEEVLNHPTRRVRHLRQQEPVDDPVGVPAGHRRAVTLPRPDLETCRRSLTSSRIP